MSRKKYRPWQPNQAYLFPPTANDLLPADHLVFFVRDLLNELDLSPIEDLLQAKDPRGERPYDPRLMLWNLVYGYCLGIYSSRRLEKATWEDLSFRVICGDRHPHFTTINEFRRVHRQAFSALFLGVLRMCEEAGMVSLGHVALDGSKVKADASKHKATSYERLDPAEQKLMAQIQELLDRSEAEDVADDERYSIGRRQFELPDELKHKESRLARLKQARARLEESARRSRAETLRDRAAGLRERAKDTTDLVKRKRKLTNAAKAEQQAEELAPRSDDDEEPPDTALPTHKTKATTAGKPKPKQQVNFIDPDSKLMKGRDGGFIQTYNVQTAVDQTHQVIVAQGVSNLGTDQPFLEPMARRLRRNLGKVPTVLTADAGYWSEAGVEAVESLGSKALVAVSRGRATERPPSDATGPPPDHLTAKEKMRWKLNTASNRDIYRMRKATVEPVFGQIKEARGFRQFSFRGLAVVRQEWDLICLVHNIRKLFNHRRAETATA